jgi:hypothetical protein
MLEPVANGLESRVDDRTEEAQPMSHSGDLGPEDSAEPPSARCSFGLRSEGDAGALVEGPERGELGAAYICEKCVGLCAWILESEKRKMGATGSPIKVPTQVPIKDQIDNYLKTIEYYEREILKLRHGLRDGSARADEDVARVNELTGFVETCSSAVAILRRLNQRALDP